MNRKKSVIVIIGMALIILSGILMLQIDRIRIHNNELNEFTAEEQARIVSLEGELTSRTALWGLEASETLTDMQKDAQEYLDQHHNGMRIDSAEFYDHVEYLFNVFDDYTMGLEAKAREDTEFARFYFYASMYSNAMEKDMVNRENYSMSDEMLAMSVEEAIHWIAAEMVRADRG